MQGKTINGYTLKTPLGTGGMAEVWLAENRIGKLAAVKMLLPKLCGDESINQRFFTEAKVMVELDHPNIRQVYDYGEIEGRPAIVMEYLQGNDMKAYMKQGRRFSQDELVKWWNQIADALNYTHEKGIVHRDIKPSNIFIDEKGDVKLLDFGIAKVVDTTSGTMTGSTLGTRIYMSPEQVKDPKRVGPKSDVYSLAVSFVHLLTGKAPYDSTTSSDYEIQVSIVTKPIDLSPLPKEWQSFLAPYLEKEPENRPALRHFEVSGTNVQPEPVHIGAPVGDDEGTVVEGTSQPVVKPVTETEPKPQPKQPEKKTPPVSETKSSSETTDKPKSKKGLWIVLGLVVMAAIGLLLTKVMNKGEAGSSRLVAEVSAKDCVKSLAGINTNDPVFAEALALAAARQKQENNDFISLFGKAYNEVDPNARLASIFLYAFKDKGVNVNSTNDEVLRVLETEYDGMVFRGMDIMENRIQLFCKGEKSLSSRTEFSVKRVKGSDEIVIEFPKNKLSDEQIEHITELLQTSGNLQFYETYNLPEIQQFFIEADAKLAQTRNANAMTDNDDEEQMTEEEWVANHPLLAKLQLFCDVTSARVGIADVKDTADINRMLAETKSLFPRSLKLAWTVKPESIIYGENGESIEVLDLVALKLSRENKCALGGEVITEARQEFGQNNMAEVAIQMNAEGTRRWMHITGENIGRQIAIVFDNYVYSYPVVNVEIPNGRSTISGGTMTVEEAQNLANLLTSGSLSVPVKIKEVNVQ